MGKRDAAKKAAKREGRAILAGLAVCILYLVYACAT